MNERIIIKKDSDQNGHFITGFVDRKEVISVNNKIMSSWGIASSSTLPYDMTLASLYIECYNAVMEQVRTLKSFKRGVRVQVNATSGFNKGAKGVIEFVEPDGDKIWVLRDGSTSPAFFYASELDII